MIKPNISIVQPGSSYKRKNRSPKHTFQLRSRPWTIQPMLIAPVLPGETLKNALLMSRVVSDPVKSRLVGWWCEYYLFYVKHRDLSIRDQLTSMHLEAGFNPAVIDSDYNAPWHYHAGGVDYVKYCRDAVVEWYFRDEEEPLDGGPNSPAIFDENHYTANINKDGWWQSMKLESDVAPGGNDEHELAGENPTIPYGVPAGFENHFTQWESMRAMQLTDASFEDYLRSFGVSVSPEVKEEIHRPELLRYIRDFQYPSNTIVPETGAASSAVSWSIAERIDKDRFFSEPGFIFGVQVVRPKVYLKNLKGSLCHYMNKYNDWLPAVLAEQPFTSLKEFSATGGPIDGSVAIGEDYWLDIKDLFIYGDQFINFATANLESGVSVPSAATAQHKYASSADADALFVSPANNKIVTDGVIDLTIASRLSDTSL